MECSADQSRAELDDCPPAAVWTCIKGVAVEQSQVASARQRARIKEIGPFVCWLANQGLLPVGQTQRWQTRQAFDLKQTSVVAL